MNGYSVEFNTDMAVHSRIAWVVLYAGFFVSEHEGPAEAKAAMALIDGRGPQAKSRNTHRKVYDQK